MNNATILLIMTSLFLCFGYLGVPVAFSLTAGVIIGAAFTDVTFAAIVQKMFDGVDSEALLAIPFFTFMGLILNVREWQRTYSKPSANCSAPCGAAWHLPSFWLAPCWLQPRA